MASTIASRWTRCSISIDTLVLGLELPQTVVAAINRKVEQYYLVQEYAFRVDREKKESERKQIEAEGIRAFQQTVSQGISNSYVRWRGIEATLQLAQSPNSKIVIIGGGKDGLPIILGNVDTPAAPRTSAGRPRTTARPQRHGQWVPVPRCWRRPRQAIWHRRPNNHRRPRCRGRRQGPHPRPAQALRATTHPAQVLASSPPRRPPTSARRGHRPWRTFKRSFPE